jgi:hypothetical protein
VTINGYGTARQITLFEHGKVALQVLTSDTSTCPVALLTTPRAHWRIENTFKYASEHHGIDALADYIADIETNTRPIDNPARKTANATVKAVRTTWVTPRPPATASPRNCPPTRSTRRPTRPLRTTRRAPRWTRRVRRGPHAVASATAATAVEAGAAGHCAPPGLSTGLALGPRCSGVIEAGEVAEEVSAGVRGGLYVGRGAGEARDAVQVAPPSLE